MLMSTKPPPAVVDEARDCLPCVRKFRVYRLVLSEVSGSWTSVLLAIKPLGVFRPLITPDGTTTTEVIAPLGTSI